jgi:hypothetical protein
MHVNVLSRLFRGRFLTMLVKAHAQGRLKFFGDHAALADRRAFKRFLAPLRKSEWIVHTKNPFAGPEQVLRYLSRYTHRVAISNRRLVSVDDNGIAFRWKDSRTGPVEDHEAHGSRVHPPLLDARAAQGLPPHPPLRPVRQQQPCRQHRTRTPAARCCAARRWARQRRRPG